MKSNCTSIEWLGRAKCSVCEVRNIVLFSGLSKDELDSIPRPIDNLCAPAGTLLYEQNSTGASLYSVRHGMIKLPVGLPNGGYRIVRLLGPGDIAGQEALLGQPYHHSAVVLQEADLCRIPAELINRLDQAHSKLRRQLLLRWQMAVDQAGNLIAGLNSGRVQARLARLLLKMCRSDKHVSVTIP